MAAGSTKMLMKSRRASHAFRRVVACRYQVVSGAWDVAWVRRGLCSSRRTRLQELTDALRLAALANPSGGRVAAIACRALLEAHATLDPKERIDWWARRALDEEQAQLNELSKALPRGGRVAPSLLDTFAPTEPGLTEAALRRLVPALGAAEGLPAALNLRGSLLAAYRAWGNHSAAGFALGRLDRRMHDVLGLWFNPGLLQVDLVDSHSPAEVQDAATGVAEAVLQDLLGPGMSLFAKHHRCFSISHPHMTSSFGSASPRPLLVAHASLLEELPRSLREAVQPSASANGGGRLGCVWALGVVESASAEGLWSLSLRDVLMREVAAKLREELVGMATAEEAAAAAAAPVVALAPLRGLAGWARSHRAWETPGLQPEHCEALRRASHGASSVQGDKGTEVSFTDEDGDSICFRLGTSPGNNIAALEVSVADRPGRRVSRFRVAPSGQFVRFVMEPGAEGMQVNVPQDVATRGDLARVSQLAEASGLLPAELHNGLSALGRAYVSRKAVGVKHAADDEVHLHLSGGAELHSIHWHADDTLPGLSNAFGMMASFVYRGTDEDVERAAAYAAHGVSDVVPPIE